MKAYIYCRVSSQRQVDEGHGLEGQEKRCKDYAESRGYKIAGLFKDEGVSGGVIDREGMKKLLNQLDSELNETVVIIDDIKRLARDVQGHFTLKTAIYSRNARLESPTHNFEDTPEGKFVETVLAGAAELERNQNKRQVISRMKARLELGYWPFMPPLGLVNKKDSIQGKILTAKEPESSLLKVAIEKYRDGLLLTQEEVRQYLQDAFNGAGITVKPPTTSTIQKILRNPLYAGYIEYKDWNVSFMKAKHEGFISLETYNLVQERLQCRTKPWKRRDHSIDFPLRPHVFCAGCNIPMTASWNKGRSDKYPNYFCRTNTCGYRWKVVRKYKMETEFEEHLSKTKLSDIDIDLAREVLQEQWDIRIKQYSEHRSSIMDEFNEANIAIKSFLDLIRKTKDEELKATYEQELKDFLTKKNHAEQKLKQTKYTNEEFGTASKKVFNTLKDPMSMWKSEDYNDKRTILFMYFEDELKYDYNLGFGTAGLAYPIKIINQLGQAKTASVDIDEKSWNRLEEYIQKWYTRL